MHPLVAQSPYAATKIAADQLAISYYRSFNVPVKIVRPFNTYGPRQSARAVIPTIITQILAGARVVRLGNLTPTRDLTFVKDTAQGFLAVYHARELVGEVTNIGMNEEISIGDLAAMIVRLMHVTVDIEAESQRVRPHNSEVERLRCDNAKMLARTTWRPQFTLANGLNETVDWLRAHMDLYKPELYTR